ncbi:hypothetical protein [Amycolatopsis sacchari]|uniref:hypothetical protein n=1 Tax=Amycolatopsis sacchari TaxID=115433 RepID=UPI003D760971
MALSKVLVDPFTRSELSRSGLEELSRNLWLGCCLSCGGELADDVPSVLAVDEAVAVTVTLHHRACRRPQWIRNGPGFLGRYITTVTALVLVPYGDPSRDPFLPTVLVNPSLEQVSLAPDEHGRYRATTVADHQALGFGVPAGGVIPRSETEDICSWLTEDALIVRCHQQYWRIDVPPGHPYAREIVEFGGVVLGISTALNPYDMRNPEPIKRVLRDGDLAAIVAPLNTTSPPPDLTSGAMIEVDSDLAHADENDDRDWLPELLPYQGPSYNPATGQCSTGVTMDGPWYWTLNTPGHGVENGIIAGPADIGKTNILRMLLVEALYTDKFVITAADPLNRNNLVDLFEEISNPQLPPARTADDTVRLLRALAAIVDYRREHADQYREPTPEHRGILLALDDAHVVLRDPDVAAAAEAVAVRGPAVSVGLVAVTESVDLAAFGGRRDLLRALMAQPTNRMAFSEEHAQQLIQWRRELNLETRSG